ncbi:MAG: sterol desaturase family protein [Planctomycetes bacterium]|nr:sterol desaturase family protein [Planctomycetota bacterium]
MPRLFLSNRDESVPMFGRRWMDVFTRVHPAVPHLLYVPLIVFLPALAVRAGMHGAAVASLFGLGLFLWTLAEYLLHRFVFHFHWKTEFGRRVWFVIHGVHHDYPRDSRRLVMPPSVSLPLCAIFWGLFRLAFGPAYMLPIFAGFVAGYLAYDTTHFAVHHFALKGRLGLFLKKWHYLHHYRSPESNFGVSSPLWDFVFGTRGRRTCGPSEQRAGSPVEF